MPSDSESEPPPYPKVTNSMFLDAMEHMRQFFCQSEVPSEKALELLNGINDEFDNIAKLTRKQSKITDFFRFTPANQ